MNVLKSIITCFRKSFTFSGFASRTEFWRFCLFAITLICVVWQADKFFFGHQATQFLVTGGNLGDGVKTVTRIPYDGTVLLGRATLLVSVLVVIPLVTVARRRLRDAGRSSTWLVCLVVLVIALNSLFLVPGWEAIFGPAGIAIWPMLFLGYSALMFVTMLVLVVQLLGASVARR